ncbi:MAG: hypothetical protein HZC02_03920 [Candidatus Levybacteria bacterium]|nr:hypothetical protein [Candidatus Levybacteria bacterium]
MSDEISKADAKQVRNSERLVTVLGNKYGHDIRFFGGRLPDGSSVLDHQPTEKELLALMFGKIEPGVHDFQGYPYPVTILPSADRLFYQDVDAIGNRYLLARIYLLGEHYKNNIGERVSSETSWSVKHDENGGTIFDSQGQPIKEVETCSFVSISYSPYYPGVVRAGFVKNDKENQERYHEVKAFYERLIEDERHMQRMRMIEYIATAPI